MCPSKTLILLVGILAGATAQATDFTSSDAFGTQSPTVQAMQRMSELVHERTHGRHRIITLGHGDSDTESFTVGHVGTGLQEMARVSLSAFNASVPLTIVLSLPYLFSSADHQRRVLDGPIGDFILASLESRGVVGLCFYDMGERSYYSTGKPITRAADLKGMRVRVQQSDVSAHFARALGATPVPLPANRISEALRSGLIDAAANGLMFYVAEEHLEVAKFFSNSAHSRPPGVVIMSKRAWDELSDADQAIFRWAARESVGTLRSLMSSRETAARETAEAAGVRIAYDIDRKSFVDVLQPLRRALLTTDEQRELVRRILANDEIAKTP